MNARPVRILFGWNILLTLLLGWTFLDATSAPGRVQASAPGAAAKATPTINRNINALRVGNLRAALTPRAKRLLPLDTNGQFPDSAIPASIARSNHNHDPQYVRKSGDSLTGALTATQLRAGNPSNPDCDSSGGVCAQGDLATDSWLYAGGGVSAHAGIFTTETFSAEGNYFQSAGSNGIVKAAVLANCTTGFPTRLRAFNTISPGVALPQVSSGAAAGECSIDFNFDLEDRYIVASAMSNTGGIGARGVLVRSISGDVAEFFRWNDAGAGQSGYILVLVY